MNILITDEQSDLLIARSAIEKIVEAVLTAEGQKCDEVSIRFVDTPMICELHKQFFDDPSVTDCISFPIDDMEETGYRVLGEVFVCPKTALDYAKANKTDPYGELTLYVVHGLLHLMGYDDIALPDIEEMRAAEQRHLNNLRAKGIVLP